MNMMKESIFKIDNYRNCFYQWDIGQKLTVLDGSITAVNYAANGEDEAYKIPVVNGKAVVPDELLQGTDNLVVWAMVYDGSQYTKASATFGVIARQKPSDYVYTPTEYETFASKLNKNLGAENADKVLVVGEDGEIEAQELDLENYATVEDLDNAVDALDDSKLDNNLGAANSGKYLKISNEGNVEAEELVLDDYATKEEVYEADNYNYKTLYTNYQYNKYQKTGYTYPTHIAGIIEQAILSDDWFEYMTTTASVVSANANILENLCTNLRFITTTSKAVDFNASITGTFVNKVMQNLEQLYAANKIDIRYGGGMKMIFKDKTSTPHSYYIYLSYNTNKYTFEINFDAIGENGNIALQFDPSERTTTIINIDRSLQRKPGTTNSGKVLGVNENGFYTFVEQPDTSNLATKSEVNAKLDSYIGVDKAGQVLLINAEGNVEPVDNIATKLEAQDFGIEGGYYPWLEWKKYYTTNTNSFKDNVTYNQPIYVTINGFTEVASNWFEYITTTQSATQIGSNVTTIIERLYNIVQGGTSACDSYIINQIATKYNIKAIAQEIQAIEQAGIMNFHSSKPRIYINNPCKEFGTIISTKNIGQSGSYNYYQVNFYYTGKTKGTTYVTCNYNFTTDTYTNLKVIGSNDKVPGTSYAGKVLGVASDGYLEWVEKANKPLIVTVNNNQSSATTEEIYNAMSTCPVYLYYSNRYLSPVEVGIIGAKFGYYDEDGTYMFVRILADSSVVVDQ